MPIMDGISMIKAVQARGGVKTRFVIISAYEEFELARQAISLGVVEYLVKPLTLEDVEAVWKAFCPSETSATTSHTSEIDNSRFFRPLEDLFSSSTIMILI